MSFRQAEQVARSGRIQTFGFPLVLFLFIWAQVFALQKYVIDDGKG